MKENSNNRKKRTTSSSYPPPPPVRKRFLAFLFAAAFSIALAGCNGESGTTDYSDDNTYKDPLKNPAPAGCMVYYQTGNGAGSPPQPVPAKKDVQINLPDAMGLTAPKEGAVFVGWNDGLLTYPPEYLYTVTKNVTFNARWAFTTLEDITTHLSAANGNLVLIAVANGESPDETLTWINLLAAIQTAGEANKTVELDLTGSTLALVDESKFDYKDGGDAYKTGGQYIKKLILPSAAASIKTVFTADPFSRLEAASALNVSAIPNDAFNGLSTLAAVVFPAAKTIGDAAFQYCAHLISVSLPTATDINLGAFNLCANLIEVSLPAATNIGNNAFQSCNKLTSVSLPAAINIGNSAFQSCIKLTEASLSEATNIGDSAFYQCSGLTSVSLPEATFIKSAAFYQCSGLTSVSLPAAKTIETGAFNLCTSLTKVSLPAAISIGQGAFSNCTNLTEVKLSEVKEIKSYAFQYCFALTSVTLLAATDIGDSAFKYCNDLTTITIAEDCNITDNTNTIRGNFKIYYDGTTDHTTKAAGVYTYSGSEWSYESLPKTP